MMIIRKSNHYITEGNKAYHLPIQKEKKEQAS